MIPSQSDPEITNPSFPGGDLALQRFVDQIKQPVATSASGTVFVEFVVNIDGSVGTYTVLRGAGPEADLEAVRIVSSMPNWTPGKIDGSPTPFKFVLPITFRD